MHGKRSAALASFPEPRRPVAARRPRTSALPAGAGIVDPTVEPLGVEAHRIRHAQPDHLTSLEGDHAAIEIAGRDRHVLAEAEHVVLIDPGVVAGLGAVVADALKAWSRILVERPAFRTVVAGRLRPVQRPLALVAVEACEMTARKRGP